MKTIYSQLSILATLATVVFLAASCNSNSSGDGGGGGGEGGGQGGSMARFTIVGDYMYTVDQTSLKVVNIAQPAEPEYLGSKPIGVDIETIFPYDRKLFVGTETGMHIYDISNPEYPAQLSITSHIRSCDPVVAAGDYAYVTLNSDNIRCNRGDNRLQVYDISDASQPVLVWTKTLTSPKGLGVDAAAGKLFVCDDGVRVYDLLNPAAPEYFTTAGTLGMGAYDVIPRSGLLIVVGEGGLYQYDYTGEEIEHLSKITINKPKR